MILWNEYVFNIFSLLCSIQSSEEDLLHVKADGKSKAAPLTLYEKIKQNENCHKHFIIIPESLEHEHEVMDT